MTILNKYIIPINAIKSAKLKIGGRTLGAPELILDSNDSEKYPYIVTNALDGPEIYNSLPIENKSKT